MMLLKRVLFHQSKQFFLQCLQLAISTENLFNKEIILIEALDIYTYNWTINWCNTYYHRMLSATPCKSQVCNHCMPNWKQVCRCMCAWLHVIHSQACIQKSFPCVSVFPDWFFFIDVNLLKVLKHKIFWNGPFILVCFFKWKVVFKEKLFIIS